MHRIQNNEDRPALSVVIPVYCSEANLVELIDRLGNVLKTLASTFEVILVKYETKNIHCGEGGSLLINDPKYVERGEVIREKGTDRSRFFRGEVDKYTWVDIGSSYIPSDILATFLYGQLEAREKIQARRRSIWQYYFSNLQDWAAQHNVKLPYVPPDCEQSYHTFYLIMPSLQQRRRLIEYLKTRGILGVFHYVPLHLSDMGLGFGSVKCHVTEEVSDRLVRLPFYNDLTENDQEFVVKSILEFARD